MIPRALPEIHCFDYGTVLEFQVRKGRNTAADLSGAFAVEILFMRPVGSNFSRPAQLAHPEDEDSDLPLGSDGRVVYVVAPGDFDVPGGWYMQLYLEIGGGAWYSSVVAFTVFPNVVSLGEILQP